MWIGRVEEVDAMLKGERDRECRVVVNAVCGGIYGI